MLTNTTITPADVEYHLRMVREAEENAERDAMRAERDRMLAEREARISAMRQAEPAPVKPPNHARDVAELVRRSLSDGDWATMIASLRQAAGQRVRECILEIEGERAAAERAAELRQEMTDRAEAKARRTAEAAAEQQRITAQMLADDPDLETQILAMLARRQAEQNAGAL